MASSLQLDEDFFQSTKHEQLDDKSADIAVAHVPQQALVPLCDFLSQVH